MYVRLSDIEKAARDFSVKSKTLRNIKERLDEELDTVQSKYVEDIKAASIEAGESYQMLLTLINDAPDLFKHRKSMILSDVKVGYRKKTGKIEINDEAYTINKLKELYGASADAYISTKLSVIKKTLDNIPAVDLKKLGVNIVEDTTEPFIKLIDDAVQKLIDAIVKESAKVAE